MKAILTSLLALLAIGFSYASPMPGKADLLAANSVIAEYVDTVHQACRFRTALCPDRCDHAQEIALFRVLENQAYCRPDQYGDDKAEKDSVLMVDAAKAIPGQDDADIHQKLAKLKPGDKVKMTIAHYYVHDGGMHYPVRPVIEMVRIVSKEQWIKDKQDGGTFQ